MVLNLVVSLCLLTGILHAGPIQISQGLHLAVSTLSSIPTSATSFPVPDLHSPSGPAARSPRHPSDESRGTAVTIYPNTLNCGDDKTTVQCSEPPHKYFCTKFGTVMRAGEPSQHCSAVCDCADVIVEQEVKSNESKLLTDNTFHALNHITERDSEVDFNALHSYALVCFDRAYTQHCAAPRYRFYCNKDGALRNFGQASGFCDSICACVNLSPKVCIMDPSKQSSCLASDKFVYTVNGTVIGKVSDAEIHPDGSLDFSAHSLDRGLAVRDSMQFKMYCRSRSDAPSLSSNAFLYDKGLTESCTERGYSCLHDRHTVSMSLHHSGKVIQECEDGCQCPIFPFISGSKVDQQPEENEYHANKPRSLALDIASDVERLSDVTLDAPPSGIPYQASTTYALSCGNREDGPPFCQQADLGYFCAANGSVARSSTDLSPSVTWCNFYCTCIFANPTPCVNEWNVPWCQEMIDGTVRDAAHLDIVLGLVADVFLMPNGSLLLDRGRPYIIGTDHYLSDDGNGTWWWSGSNQPPK